MVKFFLNTHSRADRQWALLLFAGTFGLYLRTLAPGLLGGDSGEFQVAAWHLGLAHPTGYPLYLMVGSLWQHLLALGGATPAYALNIFSALLGAAAVALLYLCMIGWLQSPIGVRRTAALFTTIFFAVNFTFWSQNLIAEVYTLHTLFIVLIFTVASQLLAVANSPRPLPSAPASAETSASSVEPLTSTPHLVITLSLITGLALTHHATTLLLLPSLALVLWQARRRWIRSGKTWALALLALVVPLLLYLYIPLRSGPAASPWYHQALGTEMLSLYQNTWPAFIAFITGQSISVGFRDGAGAVQQLGQAWLLWRLHLLWPGLVLALLGLYQLIRQRNWPVLALTVPFFLIQQTFNLFYAIGDILVYYIPLYLVAAIWAGFAADTFGGGIQRAMLTAEPPPPPVDQTPVEAGWQRTAKTPPPPPQTLPFGIVLVLVLFWLPIQLIMRDFSRLDQSQATSAQSLWQTIAAVQPPADAILVSNDRNEIVPLFYLQAVERQLTGITGLFPLMVPDARFADIGATLETALTAGQGRPVYLIKAMPGLESRFALTETAVPLVQVLGSAAIAPPTIVVDQPYGPLQLLGYDWQPGADNVQVTLHWQVQAAIAADYTTTVQLFDANGEKVAQNDAPAGGVYYPTSLWKPGEVLVERHQLTIANKTPITILIGMYTGTNFTMLAPALKLPLQQ